MSSFSYTLEEGYDPVLRLESDVTTVKQDTTRLKPDVRLIAERMEQGLPRMDERFIALSMTVLAVLVTLFPFLG